ncbi:hypothetical protein ORV05_19560 [Amycolatopsis cynarae]|uniref:DUF3562 domain-containing protein n=1 Tax=Amycolatopsis cynarae TaxID=2995223 RepID=A0ABY7AUN0_9PSEU|nr:hypothetical protein [Amycolatopsis sp. HUAS 11-8]WAL63228.1 hypothetical protein ORV05_19560 [Amycolatopsis sp. HUAS 11-8]
MDTETDTAPGRTGTHPLDAQFHAVERRLVRELRLPAEKVHELVAAERARFADARVQTFVPILVERAVRTHLSDPAARRRCS